MIRLKNDSQGMILHYPIYKKILSFCQQFSPEQPGEAVAKAWLSRVYSNDESIHILIDLDDKANIIGHAVIETQRAYGGNIVIIHQLFHDKPSLADIDLGIEYTEKLAASINACSIICFITEHSKALERRYNFKVSRTMMVKDV